MVHLIGKGNTLDIGSKYSLSVNLSFDETTEFKIYSHSEFVSGISEKTYYESDNNIEVFDVSAYLIVGFSMEISYDKELGDELWGIWFK